MAINGRYRVYEKLQYRVKFTASGHVYMYGGVAGTQRVVDVITTAAGIAVAFYSNSQTPIYTVAVEVQGSTIRTVTDAAWHSTTETIITLHDVVIYTTLVGNQWRTEYSSIDIDIDGSLTSHSGGTFDAAGLGPCYERVQGVPWQIGPLTDFDTDAGGALPEYGEGLLEGGWRFDEGSGWETLPVLLPPFGVSSGAAIPPADILSATNTWDGEIKFKLWFYGSGAIPPSRGTAEECTLILVPNLPKRYEKIGVTPRDIWYRKKMPTVTALDGIQVRTTSTIVNLGGEVALYTEQAEFLEVVNGPTSVLEDILAPPTYAPCSCSSGDKLYTVPFPDNPIGTTMSFAFPYAVSYAGSTWPSYLSHASPVVEYLSSWASPHWHIFSYAESWYVNGSNTAAADYWWPIREKWLHNSDANIDLDTRNSVVLDPLPTESAYEVWWQTYTDSLPWVGAHVFPVQEITILDTYTYDSSSSSLWTDVTGTASFGGSITIAMSGGTSATELRLGSWTVEPFMWPHLATHITVDWSAASAVTGRVYVVGQDGEEELLEVTPGDGFTTDATRYRLPQFGADKFAGSWVTDNGYGVVSESATDVGADGISSTVYGDPEGSASSLLGPTGVPIKLRFEFDCASSVTLQYPLLEHDPDGPPSLVVESSNVCAIIWPNGPALRYGWQTYYNAGLQNPPLVRAQGDVTDVVDALCFKRQFALAQDHDDGLTTELTGIYDTFEGQAVSTSALRSLGICLPTGWASGDLATVAIGKLFFALVNTVAEAPPVAWLARRSYNTTTWQRSGDFEQVSYHWSQGRRDYVSTGSLPMHLVRGSTVHTGTLSAPVGWSVSACEINVTNEDFDFEIWRGGVKKAEDVVPFHGYFGAFAQIDVTTTSGGIANTRTPWGYYVEARSTTSGITVGTAFRPHPVSGAFDVTSTATVTGDSPSLMVTHAGDIDLVYHDSGVVQRRRSTDHGATWSAPTGVSSGMSPRVGKDQIGNEWVAWFVPDSGTSGPGKIHVQTRKAGEASFGTAVVLSPTFDDGGFDITSPFDIQCAWILAATLSGGTSPTRYKSVDLGATWAAI